MLSNNLTKKCFRAVPGKKVLVGVERNLKMGVPQTQFYLFFKLISVHPQAIFHGTALSRLVF